MVTVEMHSQGDIGNNSSNDSQSLITPVKMFGKILSTTQNGNDMLQFCCVKLSLVDDV